MFNEQFEYFFGFFGIDLEERFKYLQEHISNNLAIRRIFPLLNNIVRQFQYHPRKQ